MEYRFPAFRGDKLLMAARIIVFRIGRKGNKGNKVFYGRKDCIYILE
jgi:hypothetical protein